MIFDGLLSELRLDCCAGLCGAVRLLPLPLPTLSLLTKLAITKRVVLGYKHLRALIFHAPLLRLVQSVQSVSGYSKYIFF
jgi:hypothetical protein